MTLLILWFAGWFTIVVLVVLCAVQVWLVAGYVRFLVRGERNVPPSAPQPKASVVLCVRGIDPSLRACLSGLQQQDYSHYDVHVVLDSRNDPAYELVQNLAARSDRFSVEVLENAEISSRRSLKCSCLLKAVKRAQHGDVIVLVDSDAVPDSRWLADLTEPLRSPDVGAVTGNRWFEPAGISIGSITRHLWNTGAIVQMYYYGIAWGGSLAIRASAVLPDLIPRWEKSLFDDTMVLDALQAANLRLVTAPGVLVVNRESIGLASTFRWIRRQLLDVRLYHSRWPLVASHALMTSVALIACVMLTVVAAIAGIWPLAVALVLAAVFYQACNAGMAIAIQLAAGRVLARRSQPLSPQRWQTAVAMILIPVCQFVYALAAVAAALARRIRWRGIEYRIQSPNDIVLVAYQPFVATTQCQTIKGADAWQTDSIV